MTLKSHSLPSDSHSASRHITEADHTAASNIRVSEHVTSRDNRWLKQFRAALAGNSLPSATARGDARGPSAGRDAAHDVVGIEGARLVQTALETALQSAMEVLAVLTSESGARHLPPLAGLIPAAARMLSTTDHLFAHVSGTETPQGIAALVRPCPASFDDLIRGTPLILVLLGVQDPGNVGTLIRTSEAFGATGIATCAADRTGTANPFGPKALRASAGSALRMPVLRGMAAPVLIAQLRVAGVHIFATCPAMSSPQPRAPWEVDWCAPVALLLGNEGAGLPAEVVRSADALVRIPQAAWGEQPATNSPMDSLNVAVAGGVLLYEAARQRGLC